MAREQAADRASVRVGLSAHRRDAANHTVRRRKVQHTAPDVRMADDGIGVWGSVSRSGRGSGKSGFVGYAAVSAVTDGGAKRAGAVAVVAAEAHAGRRAAHEQAVATK